jgi:hypothetical protein
VSFGATIGGPSPRFSGTGVKKEILVSIEILGRDLSPTGTGHEHITTLYWVQRPGGVDVESGSRAAVVKWIGSGGQAYVEAPRIQVRVVTPSRGEKYVRTYADGRPTNNLLSLPTGAQLAARR